MKVNGKPTRTIWIHSECPEIVQIIDQRWLPHQYIVEDIGTVESMAIAIRDMHVRGAGLIGAAAGYGMYLAALEAKAATDFDSHLDSCYALLESTRPTAVNLAWALDRQLQAISKGREADEKIRIAMNTACAIADEDADFCRRIGQHGLSIIREISTAKNGDTVNILTHCNAGWLAFVDYGSATAPIYAAHDAGIMVHVYVDETRPRNQGAALTAWELGQHGVPHTLIVDNAGGHLMQHGMIDLVITGTDRTTVTGDVANKIGTYLKALAAKDNTIPFYVALPSSTFDWKMKNGLSEIPIEQRNPEEITHVEGLCDGKIKSVRISPTGSPAANYAFDVTPARLVTGLITERGICRADRESILQLFPEGRHKT
ncbi:S-methyl-5-thioribose-1-phosphate isomerase [Puniceicoccales bacterium CK1056]|uniref:Methylthioribose-1-phosphate isomerase n=1 Tax=Oceanipulchritudo coccoides TaxID=2706888 RepID=A0A6B2LZ70_9BACT|nr:S-methyl-5-thioribose-1-phosphate isomerase [Oceanipulchritudo coccoides]NDV61234.1 S-methyl-5-thioribose-1-phosphate isomerase [Oceanipulchritudo coccoides]